MHQFWESIIEPALSILKPKTIVEVGAAQGENTWSTASRTELGCT
jgi:hypothetical protein